VTNQSALLEYFLTLHLSQPRRKTHVKKISTTANSTLMTEAREALKGKWGLAVGVAAIWMLLVGAIQCVPAVGGIISFIICGPLSLGLAIIALAASRKQEAEIGQLFKGFDRFGTSFCAYLLQAVFVFLWMLLLIIPGIIAGFSYSQTYFILVEDKTITASDAIKKSKALMDGNKWKYACLGFRFFGWGILSILTLGIGFLWLLPYIMVTYARFYDEITGKRTAPVSAEEVSEDSTGTVIA
jgi:uncharacterized membrane protein